MVQFCYSRLYLGTETISCCLCQRMARMHMDCNLKKLGQGFQVLQCNAVPAKIAKKIITVSAPR